MDLNDDGRVYFPEFSAALTQRLHLSISEHEVQRVWRRLEPTADAHEVDTYLTMDRFRLGLRDVALLRLLVGMLGETSEDFRTPPDFNYAKTTNDNYSVAGDAVFGKYASIRKTRDYNYHVNYSEARQHWQDGVVDAVVSRTEPQANPWIVYTCGPMGAGKGFVLSWMSRVRARPHVDAASSRSPAMPHGH